ncbi:peptidase M28 [bacterium (candidate division B38) B3_B38]|nr:MAG: peptidase M28 [bacterium (candidate division B38) B3_B38]
MRKAEMLKLFFLLFIISVILYPLLSCRGGAPSVKGMLDSIDAENIRAHLRFLSHDLLEGRGTGQRGGQLAAHYIAEQFALVGLKPALEGGSYLQPVPLVGVTTDPASSFSIRRGRRRIPMKYLDDYVLWTEAQQEKVSTRAELVFVGYGIIAPEYQWDDYKGVDVKDKILVMVVNDPPSEDPNLFGGKALTYYGRWTYKYEIAAKVGAKGAILIHTDESAGYRWNVVRNSWGREQTFVGLDETSPPALALASWVTEATGRELLKLAGQDFDQLRDAAAKRDFRPLPLGLTAEAEITSKVRDIITANVIGIIEGTDRKDELVVYTSHWDHMGIAEPVNGDPIYNGAVDNASGAAALIEVARALANSPLKPKRTVMFISPTCEEGGLRGAQYYAEHPLYPPGKTAANINMDSVSVLGRTVDFCFLGADRGTLWPTAEKVAQEMEITMVPDPAPGQGFYYRSDHFPFAKVGVPAVSMRQGNIYEGRSLEWGVEQSEDYRKNRYHQPSDEYDPSWDLTGAAQMARVSLLFGWYIANMDEMPTWNPGDEFAQIREESLK